MKFLRNIFDNAHAALNKSEKTKKYFPLVDAFDTLMFTPNHTTKGGAHVRDAIDLKRTMMMVIMALVPALLMGMYNVGYQHYLAQGVAEPVFMDAFLHGLLRVLPLIVVSYGVGLGIEFIFCIKNGHAIQEGFLVSGMLIPLIMPIDTPLWMVGVGTAFGVVIGKEVFGGTGMNIMNVALTARAFLFFAYPTKMSGNEVWISGFKGMKTDGTLVDGVTGATPLGELAAIGKEGATFTSLDQFTAAGHEMGDLLLGLYPGSVGETSAIAILIGAALLLKTGIASWKVMLSFFVGGYLMALTFNMIGGSDYFELPAIKQVLLGGFMFGMVFMITDPVTAAQTSTGKYIYGFLGGFLAILIRVVNPAYPEGVMLAILIANVFAPLIDHMVVSANIKRRLKRVKTA
ncbi:MAG: NADH:ubiquinone reductase (Na(+)-transporting) subunit B [Flavobacteriales bacterium]|nr:NADH:ubiquinone reductase (Na(+)-transporting) subunit B [Flavobacteriales bacterium]